MTFVPQAPLDGPRVVTIVDVARHARVAPSTVSYALTGRRKISAATKQRVLESMRALGYQRETTVRASTGAGEDVLALLLPWRKDLDLPVVTRVMTAVMTEARRHGQEVLLVTADRGAAGVLRVAGSARVGGLIVMDVETDDERLPILRELARPSVLIGVPVDSTGLTCVDLDFTTAGALAVDHLAGLGHRRVGLLGAAGAVYERATGSAHRVMAGFAVAAIRHDLATTTWPVEPDRRSVQRLFADLLDRQPALSGLVVHNDAALPVVLETLRALGRRVPEDVEVVAICSDQSADQPVPRLTTVRVPAEELGHAAVALLMRKIKGEQVPAVSLLRPELIDSYPRPNGPQVRQRT